jgi:hypothetical protein
VRAPRAPLLLPIACASAIAGCGGAGSTDVAAPAGASAASAKPASEAGVTLPRARVVMDAPAASTLVAERSGTRLYLESRARIAIHEDGRVSRARALLPRGQVKALELPARFGGRWLFTVVGGTGSQIFAADTWTSELTPMVSTPSVVDIEEPVVPGFDRLYVRIKSQNLLLPIDPTTGASVGPGSLPPATSYGGMVFVDGWRAVVDADLRGLVATFDAGATWRPLPPVDGLARIGEQGGDPALFTASGTWALRGDGRLVLAPSDESARATTPPRPDTEDAFRGKPLRAALEDGWPDGAGTAVVARRGTLARISLADGRVLSRDDDAFPEREATCHAIPLGRGIGFACGEPDAGTTIYQLVRGPAGEASIAMREDMRWDDARRVVPSGNGAAVISGSCAADVVSNEAFCVRAIDGSSREIRLRGATSAPRLVALADGRVAIVVAPTADLAGQLTLLDGDSAAHVPLAFKPRDDKSFGKARKAEEAKPKAAPAKDPKKPDVRDGLDPIVRGTWLDGMQEVEPNVIGGWIEGGGPVAGIRITLDGKVELGEVVEEDAVLVAGPFGLAFDAGGRAIETTDFGRTWTERDMAPVDMRVRDVPRACGPAGCALPNLLRVGWGEPAVKDDLSVAPEPTPAAVPVDKLASKPLSLTCDVVSGPHGGTRAAKPPPPKKAPAPARPPPRPPKSPSPAPPPPRPPPVPTVPVESPTPNGWQALRGEAAPALAPGESGFDGGQPFEQVAMRAYAWGTRSSWARTGKWLVRYDDRFDLLGLRSTRPTTTPWSNDISAAEAFGTGSFSYAVSWAASLESSGRLAVASGCVGRVCSLYLAEDDGAVVPLRDPESLGFARPIGPPVSLGRTTWFLSQSGIVPPPPGVASSDPIYLNRADGAVVTRVATLRRPGPPRFTPASPARLVRRARGEALGILTTTYAGPNDRRGKLVIVPVDLVTGALGEPIAIGRADLADREPRACGPADDGWLIELSWDRPVADVDLGFAPPPPPRAGAAPVKGAPAVVVTRPRVSGVEARVRVDATTLCVEAFAAATDAPLAIKTGATKGAPGIPMAVSHRGSGERWGLRCVARP